MSVGLGNAAPAPFLRTSLAPSETADLHQTGTGEMFLRTSRGPGDFGTVSASTVSGTRASVSTRIGSGVTTRPSTSDGPLAWMKSKFEAFKTTMLGVGEKLGEIGSRIGHSFSALGERIMNAAHTAFDTLRSLESTAGSEVQTTGGNEKARKIEREYKSWNEVSNKASTELGAAYQDCVFQDSNKTDAEKNGTLLRGKSVRSKFLSEFGKYSANDFAKEMLHALPDNKALVFLKKDYDPATTRMQIDGQPIVTPENKAQQGADAADLFRHKFDSFTGTDPQSRKAALEKFPQGLKDMLATGYKAIDENSMPDELKAKAKEQLGADLFLRVYNPALINLSISLQNSKYDPPPTAVDKIAAASLVSISSTMQTISNGLDIEDDGKGTIAPEVTTVLALHTSQIQANLKSFLAEAAAQGNPHETGNGPALRRRPSVAGT